VDALAIARRLEAGEVVLVPHLGYSPTGEVFNLSWEDVAQSVAGALRADKLLLFVDRLPTDRRGAVIGELATRDAEALLKKSDLGGQATRALRHALAALAAGVSRVHLISRRTPGAALLELFTHSGVGTMITAEPMQRLRDARIEDVGGILALIEPLEADGTLVKRGRERLEREISNFQVMEHDGMVVGCAAIYPLPEKSAELACLAVAPEARDAGHGERLLRACEVRARALKLRRLFALTTRAAHWFLAQGFKPADPSALPGERQALYNWKRGSKVFLKRI
jgi:amino-acid N-acetyltransferase